MHDLPILSASQISTYLDCKRKWAFRYISGIKTPPHPSAALGSETHDEQLAPYLREGKPFDFTKQSGEIAISGVHWLPAPKTPGMEIEQHFQFSSPTGKFEYHGYKDFTLVDSKDMPGLPGGAPLVGDHKTTSSLRWMKTREALSTDVQAIIYAKDTLDKTGAEDVDLAWVYYQTKGAKRSDRVHLRLHKQDVEEVFSKIDALGTEMVTTLNQKPNPLDLAPSPSACEAYGGCPYRDRCNLSTREVMRSIMSQGTSALLARLKAQTPNAAPPATQAPGLHRPAWLDAPRDPGPVKINPPESDLPAVEAADPMTTSEAAIVQPATEPGDKPKRARRTKAGIESARATEDSPAPATIPAPPPEMELDTLSGQPVVVTWGEEVFRVGPFNATIHTRPGESISDAATRGMRELDAFAVVELERKAHSFLEVLGRRGR